MKVIIVENAMTAFMSLSEAETMFLSIILNEPSINDHRMGFCAYIVCAIHLRNIDRNLVCIIKHGHAEVNPIMGKVLEIRRHSKI